MMNIDVEQEIADNEVEYDKKQNLKDLKQMYEELMKIETKNLSEKLDKYCQLVFLAIFAAC
jgi:hypothetical protein